jgi:dihydropteroate synthase
MSPAPREFAGLKLDRPLLMGIVNVTPDSFSDGGQFFSSEAALAHGLRLVQDGADILDIGGESTRPGAEPVPLDEELRRVLPVVAALARQTSVPISVDTSKAEVARQCLDAGARIINDVTALAGDPAMAQVARASEAGVILMHMQGTPPTMQADPRYREVVNDVYDYLERRLRALTQAGFDPRKLAVDPGIGFGKTTQHNLELLRRLEVFQGLGQPVCLGVSRKGFISKVVGERAAGERLAGSLAIACHALAKRAVQILRVHDVRETRDAVQMFEALGNYPKTGSRNL